MNENRNPQPILQKPSPNFNTRGNERYPDLLIMHYTGMKTAEEAIDRLCDGAGEPPVSAHYVVGEDGGVIQMVDEASRAWHAGVSWWEGIMDNNARAVGIEIVNPGHEFGYRPFPDVQMQSVLELAKGIIARHTIKPWHVVGHSDVAPMRKNDPGELFDWAMLAQNGVGLWPSAPDVLDDGWQGDDNNMVGLRDRLEAYGYGPLKGEGYDEELTKVIMAFQRHFVQDKIDGYWCGRANHCLDWLLRVKLE
jgi:N-acetylmuramoyl-L-alanine amidase